MISKNIVLIETIDSSGTGFLYPCKYEEDFSSQYFIIFTNSHVLKDIGLEKEERESSRNYKDQIILSFYDSLGNKVSQKDIKEIKVYNSGNFMRSEEDIAALLIAVRNVVPMTLTNRVCHRQLDNREKLYIEGYPGVLREDEVCGKIQLEGIEKKIFPSSEKLGIYQITDDYHWYNDYKDRSLLQGMSGSVVYLEEGGRSEILGMAQSVSDINQGENPFKLMYYIKFSQMLRHLRKANCIIFTRETEECYQIHWIYGKKPADHRSKLTLLMLGGSGAGKSSFARNFAYHGNQICSTNDGQTTRTKVIYNYRIRNWEEKSGNRADVKFLTKEEFTDRMMENVGQRPALLIVKAVFGLKASSINDAVAFLENCYSLLQILKKQNPSSWRSDNLLDDIREGIHHLHPNKKMIKCYEEIVETFGTYLPMCAIKYILDDGYIIEIRKKCLQEGKKGREFLSGSQSPMEKELSRLNEAINYCDSPESSLDVLFRKFQEAVVKYFMKNEENGSEEEKIELHLGSEKFRESYIGSLLSIEGYFALEEFQDVFSGEEKEKWLENIEIYKKNVTVDSQNEDIAWENKGRNKQLRIAFFSQIESIYGELHGKIKKYLIDKYAKYGINDNNLSIYLDLDNMDDEKRKLLQKCLQVTPQGSLTGVVNYVTVDDMVSDDYAVILEDLKIRVLQLVDTCGLDHVGMNDQQELKNRLYDTLYYYNENKRIKLEDISVLYMKKLDSGKPDELRQVLPCVREVFPASPVYCVFTGVDIFYRTAEEIDSLNWNYLGGMQPKAVSFLLSGNGRKLFECPEGEEVGKDRNMYLVMRNNLIPYCGKKCLISNNYSYYKNNFKYIRKLFASIVMKEYSCLEIIDTELIDIVMDVASECRNKKKSIDIIIDEKKDLTSNEKEDCKQKINKILDDVDQLVERIFREASLKSYDYRYNTKRADILSFCKRNKLGYYGTYRHRLDQRFHEGYVRAIEQKGRELAKHFAPAQNALDGALKNMETKYLGSGNNLINLETDDKNQFRNILEKMYKKCYKYNPFQKEEYAEQEFEEKRNEIFDEIFDFCKGLADKEIRSSFRIEFISCLKNQIYEDNNKKSENLLKLNPKFAETLVELEKDYFDKYRTDSDREEISNPKEMREKFRNLMTYYFGFSHN